MRIIPGRKYTFAELEVLRQDPDLADREMRGYVLRYNLDGTGQFVHWTQAGGAAVGLDRTDGYHRNERVAFDPNPDWGELPAIVKRTPQQRKESLIKKWWASCKEAGTVPGLSDEQVTEIVGMDWKTGTSEMTGEVVERLASVMLADAERKAG